MLPSLFVVPATEGLLEGSDKFQIFNSLAGLGNVLPNGLETVGGAGNINTFLDLLL